MTECKRVWKDVTVAFIIAGIVAAFIPDSFFQTLVINSGEGQESFFFCFAGSMGTIPLAALLFDKGISFARVIAFLFGDLVVFPFLRIHAKYYGWPISIVGSKVKTLHHFIESFTLLQFSEGKEKIRKLMANSSIT